jgi:ribosomal protein S25
MKMSEDIYQKALELVPEYEILKLNQIMARLRISYPVACNIMRRMIDEGVIPEPTPKR